MKCLRCANDAVQGKALCASCLVVHERQVQEQESDHWVKATLNRSRQDLREYDQELSRALRKGRLLKRALVAVLASVFSLLAVAVLNRLLSGDTTPTPTKQQSAKRPPSKAELEIAPSNDSAHSVEVKARGGEAHNAIAENSLQESSESNLGSQKNGLNADITGKPPRAQGSAQGSSALTGSETVGVSGEGVSATMAEIGSEAATGATQAAETAEAQADAANPDGNNRSTEPRGAAGKTVATATGASAAAGEANLQAAGSYDGIAETSREVSNDSGDAHEQAGIHGATLAQTNSSITTTNIPSPLASETSIPTPVPTVTPTTTPTETPTTTPTETPTTTPTRTPTWTPSATPSVTPSASPTTTPTSTPSPSTAALLTPAISNPTGIIVEGKEP